MQALLNTLHLSFFEEYSRGDVLYHMSSGAPLQKSPEVNGMLSYHEKGGVVAPKTPCRMHSILCRYAFFFGDAIV
jgi:hypothetical protein